MTKQLSTSLWILALVLFIQGCSIAKLYQRPDAYTLESYRADVIDQGDSSLGNYRWQDLFTDPILAGHIESGLANNLDSLKTLQNLKIAKSLLKQAKAQFQPTLDVGVRGGVTSPTQESFQGQALPDGDEFGDFSVGGFMSWEIDLWGELESNKKAAVAKFLQAENGQKFVNSQLVSAIAISYYQLIAFDQQVRILESTIKTRHSSIRTIKALKQSGDVSEVAVKQYEAQLYQAQSLLIDVNNAIKIQENALSILLAQAPGSIQRNSDEERFTQLPVDVSVGLPIELLSNRPDVLAAEYNLISAFELSNAARAQFYPNLTISASGGLNSENFGDLFESDSIFGTLFGDLLQPVFNRRALKTQEEIRLSEQEIALYNYKLAILTAYGEVSDSIYTYQASDDKYLIKQKEIASLMDAIRFSEELQVQGLANYLEVLRARDNALSAQLSGVEILNDKRRAIISLYKALGGGWQ